MEINDRDSCLSEDLENSPEHKASVAATSVEEVLTEAEKQKRIEEEMIRIREEKLQAAVREEAITSRLKQMYKLKGKMDHRKISKSREIYSQLKLEK